MAKKDEDNDALYGFIGLIILGLIAFNLVPKVFNFITGGSSDAKEYCGRSAQVLNAKTDRAAKLAFKSCVKSYDRN